MTKVHEEAQALQRSGQWAGAARLYRTVLAGAPDDVEAHWGLGRALQELGRHAEAAEHLRRAVRLRPDSAPAHNALGLVLRELKRAAEALAHFGKAAELDPALVSARANLGRLLLEMGRPAEALPHLREALRQRPEVPVLYHHLGSALRALGQLVEARAAFLEAVRLAPSFAQAHHDLGLLLRQQGQLKEAVPWLQKAAELEKQNFAYWKALAELHWERGASAEAIPCYQHLLTLDPTRPEALIGLGWALQQEGRTAEAKEHYRTALRLQPELVVAQVALGGLHEEVGELAEAEAAFRRARRMQPADPLPLSRLAKLLRGKLSPEDCAALEAHLADSRLSLEFRAALSFGLVQVLDARGEYRRAAEVSRQANAVTLEWMGVKRDYDSGHHERWVDGVLRFFDRDFFTRVSGGGLPTRRPVFVFGLPRSGTTLIEQVLASHPLVFGGGELRLGRETFVRIPAVLGRQEADLYCVPYLDAAAIRRLAEEHLERLGALDGGRAERAVDKLPDNYMYVGFLAALFPQATFIHCKRDLRDIAVSCWLTEFGSIPWANDIGGIAVRFRQYVRLMRHWKEVLPAPIHEVVYEETVEDLEGTARRLIAACGLEWDPACLEYHRNKRSVRTASVSQVRQPVYKKSVARWKHYEGLLDDLFAALPREDEPAA
jgi:tetratricopeptide (TPR) repeat protein